MKNYLKNYTNLCVYNIFQLKNCDIPQNIKKIVMIAKENI